MPDKLLISCILALIVAIVITIMTIYSTAKFHGDDFDQRRDRVGQVLYTSSVITTGLSVIIGLITYMVFSNSYIPPENSAAKTNDYTRGRGTQNDNHTPRLPHQTTYRGSNVP